MKIERDKVHGGSAAGERNSRRYWPGGDGEDDGVDYEALFRSFMEKLFANRGAFKVDGSLLFEFLPKAHVRNEQLISAETSFFFHQMEEVGYSRAIAHKNDNTQELKNFTASAMDSYHYHKKTVPPVGRMDEFMPII